MTRGYIIVKKGSKIKKACYLFSDAYPSAERQSYGLKILEAYKSGDFDGMIDRLLRAELAEAVTLSRRNYVGKNKDIGISYAYEYDEKTGVLTVFAYGKKVYSFTPEQREYAEYVFSNHYRIYDAFAYDEETLSYLFGDEAAKAFMDRMNGGKSVGDIEREISERIASVRVVAEFDGYIVDDWQPENRKNRVKVFDRANDEKYELYFIRSFNTLRSGSKKYDILLQTPCWRAYVSSQSFSLDGAKKQILAWLKQDWFFEACLTAGRIFRKVEAFQSAIRNLNSLSAEKSLSGGKLLLQTGAELIQAADKADVPYFGFSEASLYSHLVDRLARRVDHALTPRRK